MSAKPIITIFGSSKARPGSAEYVAAYELGRALAAAGWSICNGGYDGTMEAAARGALTCGGETIGVTSKAFRTRTVNRKVTTRVSTNDLYERLRQLVDRADAFVVLPGGAGTLLEFALVMELVMKGKTRRRPIVLLGEYWRPVWDVVAREHRRGPRPKFVLTADEVVAAVRAGLVRGK